MSTTPTPASGTRRGAVQQLYVSGTEEPVIYFKKIGDMKPWGVRVTGIPLRKIKRLAEIAAYLEGTEVYTNRDAWFVCSLLGLTAPQPATRGAPKNSKKAGRKLK